MSASAHVRSSIASKLVSAERAVAHVKDGDSVSFTMGREPEALGFALARRILDGLRVRLYIPTPGLDFGWYAPGIEHLVDLRVSYVHPRGVTRDWIDNKRGDFLVAGPNAVVMPRGDESRYDVVMTELAPPDEDGYCNFGPSRWDKLEHLRCGKLRIGELNEKLIRPCGDNRIHLDELDLLVEHERQAGWGVTPPVPPPEASQIAGFVNELIGDGVTLQIGGGRIPEALVEAGALNGRCDLGLHTELTARGIPELVAEGVINGAQKSLHRGIAVATAVGGRRKQMEFMDQNPAFEVHSVFHVSDPRIIAAHDEFVAINGALTVDLTGQIAAESLGPRMWSGAGGQPAFAMGATLSKGGKSVTVMASTAADGTRSRVVPELDPGTIVTVPRTLADMVVTEYGVAELRGRTQRERAAALVAIAHPQFRGELTEAARDRF